MVPLGHGTYHLRDNRRSTLIQARSIMHSDIYLVSDAADFFQRAGCKMRTPAAVRQGISDGRLHPDLLSPRGVKAWTAEALARDVAAQYRRDKYRAAYGALKEPTQLQIGG